MAAPYNPPVKNEDLIIYIALRNADDTNRFVVNPTIAAGDFKVVKDGGAATNLTTLPVVTPAGGRLVKVTVSATEMNADNVAILGVDQTDPPEWSDFLLTIPTTQ